METAAKEARNAARDASGRYKKNTCECCGKGAPMDYYSETDKAGKYWGVLCRKCSIKIVNEP